MSDIEEEMGAECGDAVAALVIRWGDRGADAIDVIECIALSMGCVLVNSKVMSPEDTEVRNITAAEAGDMVAEFVEDGFKSTRMMMLEEQSNNPSSK
tara:strand:- start:16678 stop:16968 length:291 start_codon:yes stop_codon:yes gene_type:complete